MDDPGLLTVAEAARRIADGRLTARALVEACLARIARLDPVLGAWVALDGAQACVHADHADREMAAGRRRGPLHGIPYGLKDILGTAELPTRAATRLPIADGPGPEAAVHRRLRAAGAILVGKLSTYELGTGTGAVYDDLPVPAARNAWDPDRFTGGSSTGAGAAVAARMVPFAIGTDTGGSVRLPAAACGLVGLKPTYGLVPRTGMLPNCASQDTVGPLTRTAEDAALVLAAIAGPDPADPSSVAVDRLLGRRRRGAADAAGRRIAVVRTFHAGEPGASPAVAAAFERAVAALDRLGARLVERALPYGTLDFRACARIVNASESFAVHRRWLDEPGAVMGAALRDKLEAAAGVRAADYLDACRWRQALSAALARAMAGCEAMLCAGAMTAAPRLDDEAGCIAFTATSAMAGFNLSGWPAVSLPAGFDGDGLPVAVQLAARAGAEASLLAIARDLEGAVAAPDRVPPDPARPPGAYARPPAPPSREGRAARLAAGMAEAIRRMPRPFPDSLEPAQVFLPYVAPREPL